MTLWTLEGLTRIGAAEELRVTSARRDGTLRNPVIVWAVRVGDDLFVRSVYGRAVGWFKGAHVRHEGRIEAGGVDEDILFVDAAYRAKYRRYAGSIVSATARSATLQLIPRPTKS